MENTIITVGSVTYAMKVKRLLLHKKIKSKLIKVLPESTEKGCTHGLSIPSSRFFDAVVILKEENIAYSVYRGKESL